MGYSYGNKEKDGQRPKVKDRSLERSFFYFNKYTFLGLPPKVCKEISLIFTNKLYFLNSFRANGCLERPSTLSKLLFIFLK